jgi:hypothetical protein
LHRVIFGVILAFIASTAAADEIKLHFMRSPRGINWSSPWAFAASGIRNSLIRGDGRRTYPIGHVFIELKCDSIGTHIFRGMTSDSTSTNVERDLIFKQRYGLGIIFHTYAGKLEKDASIEADLSDYEGSARKGELAIDVSPGACARMVSYAQEFEARGYGKLYSGLQADPLKGEGAGCSAFVVSFLRVGGLMAEEFEAWKRIIDVPKRFVGGPLTGNRVNPIKFLGNPFSRWSNRIPHINLQAWDPESMHRWVREMYQEVTGGTYSGKWEADASRDGDTFKVRLDMRQREVPVGPFWI